MAEPNNPKEPLAPKTPGKDGGQTVLERAPKLHKPKMFKVVLHNDDYTTMEFVVWILEIVFQKNQDEAFALMLAIHETGRGVAGVYTKDVAESLCDRVVELAEANGMPLMCTTEPE
ncbi:MAG: ATP-dependent Clp protease adaptor ClpS [Deltaproteobacteria bacterium]|jgi:ATP-dependent Clp protease adaptor protein ClpS|nr:ATP-dependent Clp protease adaptor ClpS [Deltaproteobacteria bacterium]